MNIEISTFLSEQRVGCLALALENGMPHTAAIHFSHTEEPLRLFFQTAKDSKKYQPLISGGRVAASFTIGFSEEEWKTLQIDGHVRLLSPEEDSQFQDIHYQKNPEAKKYRSDDTGYLIFEPSWWRFSDFNIKPVRILEGT